jgi:hypothetical protein
MKEAKVKHTKFNLFVWRRLPECKEMVKVITASMDAKLSWREWLLLKIHLLSCDPCLNFLKQLKLIRTVLRIGGDKLGQVESEAKLSEDSRARMKRALETTNPGI